jgi:drug/metabolite transporter (DMT)-like permease
MNYIQHYFIKENEVSIFASTTFLFAFIFGVLFLLFKILKEQQKIYGKNILAGFLLGIPNYYSMFFLIKALQNKNLESATIFTLINIGVILLTTIFSILFFKEKLKPQNYIGILLAITAVFLVTN